MTKFFPLNKTVHFYDSGAGCNSAFLYVSCQQLSQMNQFLFPKLRQADVNKISVQHLIPNTLKRTLLDLHSVKRTGWGRAKKLSWKQKVQKASPCSSLDRGLWDTHINHISRALRYLWDCNIYFCFYMIQRTLTKIPNDLHKENSSTAFWPEGDQRAFPLISSKQTNSKQSLFSAEHPPRLTDFASIPPRVESYQNKTVPS